MKIKGREVIDVNFTWTLDEMEQFMKENWDTTEQPEFTRGKPQPMSIEEFLMLPATPNMLVIAYPRKNKVIFSVAQNKEGAKTLALTAIPSHNTIYNIAKSAATLSLTKEMKGPAAEICALYAEYMKELLQEKGLL